jgi:hypothetical protein
MEGHSAQYRPLVSYGVLAAAFNGVYAGGALAARRRNRLPERFGPATRCCSGRRRRR